MLGRAAMLLSFDIAPDAIAEHDDWHTHEHLPERLSIPGFLRGTRWVALREGQPRYFVIYEVRDVGVLTSEAYLARLDNPTPWTSKMMQHYRGMTRGFCSVTGSAGLGLGNAALVVRLKPSGDASALRDWLVKEAMPGLSSRPGLGGCYLLESAAAPPMTSEQRIRGADAGVDWVLVATGYDAEAVAGLERSDLEMARSAMASFGLYRTDYSLHELEAKRAHDPAR